MENLRSVTVRQRIIEVNEQYQRSFVGNDIGFFVYTIPKMLSDIDELIQTVQTLVNSELADLNLRMSMIKKDMPPAANEKPYWTKENDLVWSKRQVLDLCHDIFKICGDHPNNILNKVIEVK